MIQSPMYVITGEFSSNIYFADKVLADNLEEALNVFWVNILEPFIV